MRKDLSGCLGVAALTIFLSACSAGTGNPGSSSSGDLAESLDRELNQKQEDIMPGAKKCKSIVTGGARFYENSMAGFKYQDSIVVSKSGFVDAANPSFDDWDDISKNKSMGCDNSRGIFWMTREDIDAQPIPVNRPVAIGAICTKEGIFGIKSRIFYKDAYVVQFIEVPGKIRILSKTRSHPDCSLGPVHVDERSLTQWSDQIIKNQDIIKKLPVCEMDTSSGEEKQICVNT